VLIRHLSDAERIGFNARLRQVYLVTKICAPTMAGIVIGLLSSISALIFVCAWNIVSCVIELSILKDIWWKTTELQVKKESQEPNKEPLLSSLQGLCFFFCSCVVLFNFVPVQQ
jgi:hypothetical protein